MKNAKISRRSFLLGLGTDRLQGHGCTLRQHGFLCRRAARVLCGILGCAAGSAVFDRG